MIGHACGEQHAAASACLPSPWPITCRPTSVSHSLVMHLPGTVGTQNGIQATAPLPPCPRPVTRASSTWVGHLTPAEDLMEENPKGPDVRFDGVAPSGQRLGGCPLVGDVAVMGKVDVLLQADTHWGCWPRGRRVASPQGLSVVGTRGRCCPPGSWASPGHVGAKETQVGRAGESGSCQRGPGGTVTAVAEPTDAFRCVCVCLAHSP